MFVVLIVFIVVHGFGFICLIKQEHVVCSHSFTMDFDHVQTDTVAARPRRADGPQSDEEHHSCVERTALCERATALHEHSPETSDYQVSGTL